VQARLEGRTVPIPGFEADEAFKERVLTQLDAIADAHRGQTVAVMTHGGVIFAYCRQALALPIVRPGPFAISNTSVSVFHVTDGEYDPRVTPHIQVIALNDTCHLEGID